MMTTIKKMIFTLAITSLASAATAREVIGKINDLITWNDGHTMIKIENGPINGCGSQYWYSLGVKGQDIKADPMLSIALAAYLSNRTVKVSTSDGVCQGGQEKITYLQLMMQ